MDKLKKKKKYYFPYKIFSMERKSKSQTNIFEKDVSSLNSMYLNNKKNTEINNYVKKLKSTILSNKIFSKYMDNYVGQTQDFCFKNPGNTLYPLKKNYQYLPVNIKGISNNDGHKDDNNNNENEDNSIVVKPYGFKYKKTRIVINNIKDKEFYHNNSAEKIKSKLFISFSERDYADELLKTFDLSNIDINNNNEIIKKNFEYLHESIINLNSFENITTQKSIEFKIKNNFNKDDIIFNMNIFSLCFNFYEIKKDNEMNDKIIKKQKLYLPFKLLSFFYLLDYTKFKNFISEIIIYDKGTKSMVLNQDKLREKIKKYSFHLRNIYQRNHSEDFKDITFYKNEFVYHKNYDWVVINENDDNNESIIYKLKIIFPKVIFEEKNNRIKVINHLNKNIFINVLKKSFIDWEKLVLFDLFSNKRFRILVNNILIGGNKYYEKTIKLYENKAFTGLKSLYDISNINNTFNNFNKSNKNYEFFISTVKKKESFYYIFIPNIILILSGERKKIFQKIILNLKESRKLFELSKYWGEINTLFKCMYKDEMNNKIYFKLNILEDMPKELYKTIKKEKINIRESLHYKIVNLNSTSSLNKEKLNYMRYKTNDLEIILFECLLNKININFNEAKLIYYKIPNKLLETILTHKDNMKIVESIIDCYNEIINNENEINVMIEEKIMIKKAYEKNEYIPYEKNKSDKYLLNNQNKFNFSKTFNKNKTFYKNNNNNSKNLIPKSLSRINSYIENQKNTNENKIDKKSTLIFKQKNKMNIINFNDSYEKNNKKENIKLPNIHKNEDFSNIKDNNDLERVRNSRNLTKKY